MQHVCRKRDEKGRVYKGVPKKRKTHLHNLALSIPPRHPAKRIVVLHPGDRLARVGHLNRSPLLVTAAHDVVHFGMYWMRRVHDLG